MHSIQVLFCFLFVCVPMCLCACVVGQHQDDWFIQTYTHESGLQGFGQYPVFTAVFTGKYRPGKNRFWTPKVGKTGKNTT